VFLSSAEVKNVWNYASVLPYAFIACQRASLPLLYPRSRQLVVTSIRVCVVGSTHGYRTWLLQSLGHEECIY